MFEPFGGSGTTLIACERTNRRCFLMEIDPVYVDLILARWKQYTGKDAVKVGNVGKAGNVGKDEAVQECGEGGMMKVEYVPIGDLRLSEYNPRQMTEKQAADLEASIRKFGLVDPLIVNRHPERKNVVIGGHQRLKVARACGIDTVPVVYVELDEGQEKELNLRLNKNTGEWDLECAGSF